MFEEQPNPGFQKLPPAVGCQGVLIKQIRWETEVGGFQGEKNMNGTPFSYYRFSFYILLSSILKRKLRTR